MKLLGALSLMFVTAPAFALANPCTAVANAVNDYYDSPWYSAVGCQWNLGGSYWCTYPDGSNVVLKPTSSGCVASYPYGSSRTQ